MIRIGFIGTGGMGRAQAVAFSKLGDCKIVAAADPSEKSRELFAAAHPHADLYSNYEDLLRDSRVDAVVVATPTSHHPEPTIAALRAGRPVLLEKPLARTVEQCRRLIEVADETKKLLMIAHCRRFDPDWGVFAESFRSGQLGPQVLWRFSRGGKSQGGWYMDDAIGGGPLFDGAIHNIDFANFLFGRAESVMGTAMKFDNTCSAIDTGNFIIRYANGCQLVVSWSWAVHGAWLHDVLGKKATFVFGPNGLDVPPGMNAHSLLVPSGDKKLLPFEHGDMYVNQARHFLDCIAGRAQCISPAEDAMQAVVVAEAVLKACREGSVVQIED